MTDSSEPKTLRLGTRGSALARAQADLVATLLREQHPGLAVVTVVIRTEGDIDKQSPLTVIGGRGVFTTALQTSLLRNDIDAAVHSAKDLPAAGTAGLRFAAFLAREDPRDVLITRHRCTLAELPASPLIGTSSRRRATQVRHARPDAQIVELRGNVDTRLRKALASDLDGIVIAAAGVTRMGWTDEISEYLPLDHFVPAPGQGALAIEVREDDVMGGLVDDVADATSALPVQVERAFLRAIGAGCATPIGAHASIEGTGIRLRCMLATDDGSRAEWRTVIYAEREAEAEAADLSRELLAMVQATTMHPGGGDGPLQGRSVLITRPKRGAGDLARLIEAAGGTALLAPSIRIDAVPFDGEAMARRIGTNTWDWIAFTSRNAVEGFLDGIGQVVAPAAVLQVVKIGAVGEATARSLRDRGIDVDIVSTGQTGADLGRAIAQHGVSGQRVLLPGGNLNRQDLADCLRDHGGEVETAQVYATTSEHRLPETLSGQLQRAEIDAVTFTSPSSAREFVRLLDEAAYRLAGVVIGCLGETTAAEARRLGLDWCVTAERPTLESLVERVAAALQARYVERDQGVPA